MISVMWPLRLARRWRNLDFQFSHTLRINCGRISPNCVFQVFNRLWFIHFGNMSSHLSTPINLRRWKTLGTQHLGNYWRNKAAAKSVWKLETLIVPSTRQPRRPLCQNHIQTLMALNYLFNKARFIDIKNIYIFFYFKVVNLKKKTPFI